MRLINRDLDNALGQCCKFGRTRNSELKRAAQILSRSANRQNPQVAELDRAENKCGFEKEKCISAATSGRRDLGNRKIAQKVVLVLLNESKIASRIKLKI